MLVVANIGIQKDEFIGAFVFTYFLNLIFGNGFWNNLRSTDHKAHQKAIKVDRFLLELRKYEGYLLILNKCRNEKM